MTHSTTHDAPDNLDAIVADALRMLQDRGAQVLNAIDDGVFFLDRLGRAIFMNEAAGRMLGFTNREVLGRQMHELTHHHYADGSAFPAEDCPIISPVTDAVQQRVGADVFWTKSGAQLPVDYTSIPIKEGRTVVGVVVTFRDISEQQFAETQTARLKGEREARAEAERAREALRASEARYRFLAANGDYRWYLGRALPQLDEHGRVVQWFGTNTDIEEQKRV